MEIVKASANLTPKDIYKLTMSPAAMKMKEVVGQRVEIAAYAVYKDVDKKNPENTQTILSIQTPEGEIFATNSPTFIDEFTKMINFFDGYGEAVKAIAVISGVSKGGREFISCTIAD